MNRLLVCGPKQFNKKQFVHSLFSEDKEFENVLPDCSQAGTIVTDLTLSTAYYTTKADVFIDEPDEDSEIGYKKWLEELLDTEARELRDSLQFIILVFGSESEYRFCKKQIEGLNRLMDDENPPQWDGETAVVLADCVNSGNEEYEWSSFEEIRESVRLVNWREMEKRIPLSIDGKLGDVDFDTALANLRDAKVRNKGVITDSDKVLVKSIIDSLTS